MRWKTWSVTIGSQAFADGVTDCTRVAHQAVNLVPSRARWLTTRSATALREGPPAREPAAVTTAV